jgi:hypothetical protein
MRSHHFFRGPISQKEKEKEKEEGKGKEEEEGNEKEKGKRNRSRIRKRRRKVPKNVSRGTRPAQTRRRALQMGR